MKLIISILFVAVSFEFVICGGPGLPSPHLGCDTVVDLFSNVTGAYIKTLCYVSTNIAVSLEAQYCVDNGLKFYTVKSGDELRDLFGFITTTFPLSQVDVYVLPIDGVKGADGTYTTSNPTEPLSSAVNITVFAYGDCLGIENTNSFVTVPCDYVTDFLCEYVRFLKS